MVTSWFLLLGSVLCFAGPLAVHEQRLAEFVQSGEIGGGSFSVPPAGKLRDPRNVIGAVSGWQLSLYLGASVSGFVLCQVGDDRASGGASGPRRVAVNSFIKMLLGFGLQH